MKATEVLHTVFYNIRTWKRAYLRLALCFLLIGIMAISFTLYFSALENDVNKVLTEKIASAQLISYQPLTSAQEEFLSSRKEVRDILQMKTVYLDDVIFRSDGEGEEDLMTVSVYDLTLTLQDKQVKAVSNYNGFINFVSSKRFLTYNETKQLEMTDGAAYLTGGAPQTKNEIAIERAFLDAFSLGEECIGHTISLIYAKEELTVFSEYVVTGIIEDNAAKYRSASFWTAEDSAFFESEKAIANTVVDVKSFRELTPLLNELNARFPEVFSTGIFNADLTYYENLTAQRELMGKLVMLLGSSLILALVLSVYYAIKHLLREKAQYLGVCRALGMSHSIIFAVLALELTFVLTLSLICAFGVSAAIIAILGAAVGELLALTFSLAFFDYAVAFAIGAALILGIGSLVSVLCVRLSFQKGITQYFKTRSR